MKIITIYNNKGGCGKTSLLLNLAYSLGEILGNKILVIDSDGQGNASNFFEADTNGICLEELLVSSCSAKTAIQKTRYSHIDIIPCGQAMKDVEIAVAEQGEDKTMEILQSLRNDLEGMYDYVLIDMSPFHNNITEYLIAFSHYVLIPCDVGRFSLEGIGTVYQTVGEIGTKVLGLVITRYNKKNSLHNQIVNLIQSKVSGKVFQPIIKESNIVSNSVSYGLCAYEYNKRFVSEDYLQLANNIIAEIERG